MTPEFDQLLVIYSAYVIAAGSPGPSTMQIMGVAMTLGRSAALMLSAGVVTGSLFWGAMAATGMSALLTRYAEALVLLRVLGGLYLIYLGIKAARAALSSDTQTRRNAGHGVPLPAAALYRQGLLMHLSNPKSVLAWIALMTLDLDQDDSWQTVVVILGGCAILSVTIFCGYAVAFSTAPMIRFYLRARRWIEGVLAFVFIAAGMRLLLSRT